MTILFYEPSFVPVSGSAGVYPGAKLYFYETGTSTAQNSYTDSALSVAHANPVIADSNGRFAPIYLDESLEDYKVVLKDSSDVTLYTIDPFFNRYNAASDVPRGYDTLAAAVADVANIVAGDMLIFKERISGSGGGGVWDAISYTGTENGYNTVDGGDSTTSFQLRQSGKDPINLNQWGLIPDDDASGTATTNAAIIKAAHIYAISQNDQTPPTNAPSDPNLGNIEITCNAGIYYIKGVSPFAATAAEITTIGHATRRRGMKWTGAGRHATVFVIQNTGAETWLYDHSSTNASIYDHVTFQDMTLRSADWAFASATYTRKYIVAAASTINGFNMESTGWEKMFVFNSVVFEGFDTAFKLRGTGNNDQHTFIACRFVGIVDKVFDINDNESVVCRMFGCDVNTTGDVFFIGPLGGGDFLWSAGTLHQEVSHESDNLVNLAAAAANPRALIHYDQEDVSTGNSSNFVNSNFVFDHIRVENYDTYQHLVMAERDNVTAYGQGFATFRNCDFSVNFIWADNDDVTADTATNRTATSTERDLVFIDKMAMDVSFDRCYFASHQLFQVTDVGNSTAVNASANITIKNSLLGWDTSSSGAGLGPLSDKLTATISAADRCNYNFSCEGSYAVSIAAAESVSSEDFSFTKSTSGINTDTIKYANIKASHITWPTAADSANRLYLPPGSVVTSVFINKPTGTGAGSATYALSLITYDAGTTIYTTGSIQEEDAYIEKADVSTPHTIGASPNNYVRLRGVNGSGTTHTTAGQFLVGYFSGN